MGKRPKRTSQKEVAAASQQTAVEDTIPYYFTSPESSTIVDAAYHPDTETLCVKFRHDNSIYCYGKFPHLLWEEFLTAPSKGKFFSSRVRPIFTGTKRVQ